MKFWQLVSIANGDTALMAQIASTRASWKDYTMLANTFPNLVKVQDRTSLDSKVDTDFVVTVLGELQRKLYLSSDNWLRSWQLDVSDKAMSVLESYQQFGADLVEAVCERGAIKIP